MSPVASLSLDVPLHRLIFFSPQLVSSSSLSRSSKVSSTTPRNLPLRSLPSSRSIDSTSTVRTRLLPFLSFSRQSADLSFSSSPSFTEILDPLESFKTFNQFFYRKLKPSARPIQDPEDPNTLVSCADCRLMCFDTVSDAQKLWIKGREFTIERLLGDKFGKEASKFDGGSVGIFRVSSSLLFRRPTHELTLRSFRFSLAARSSGLPPIPVSFSRVLVACSSERD